MELHDPTFILCRAFGHIANRENPLETQWPLTWRELYETYQIIEFCQKLLRWRA